MRAQSTIPLDQKRGFSSGSASDPMADYHLARIQCLVNEVERLRARLREPRPVRETNVCIKCDSVLPSGISCPCGAVCVFELSNWVQVGEFKHEISLAREALNLPELPKWKHDGHLGHEGTE